MPLPWVRLVLGLVTEMNRPRRGQNPIVSKGANCVNAGVQKVHHCEQVTSEPEKKVLETGREMKAVEGEKKTIPGFKGLLLSR